jgi:hypothetical protein
MPQFAAPPDASVDTVRSWFGETDYFRPGDDVAVIQGDDPAEEPIAVAMMGAWSAWCRSQGYTVLAQPARFAVEQVRNSKDSSKTIENLTDRFDLQSDPEALAAVRFCLSELIRNVLEHSNSADGAFVAAKRFDDPARVSIAVADCGQGIPAHIARAHPDIADDLTALGMALRPGITGAQANAYGTPDNAGAGLYITRSIAKASGGAFFLASRSAAYRVRPGSEDDMMELFVDAFDDPRADHWSLNFPWLGTVASIEIRIDVIAHYENLVEWVLKQVPRRAGGHRRIRFT